MEKAVKIIVLENEVQARILESVLKEQGIPHVIRSYHDSAYDGLFQVSKGWGCVEAPKKFKSRILDILNDLDAEKEAGPPQPDGTGSGSG
jgi:hypothetical protein